MYIITNSLNTALYTGMTSDISLRIDSHKEKFIKTSFSARYNCQKLVHVEVFEDFEEARYREYQIKNWRRAWKEDLIEKNNPGYQDLSENL